jgi:hypothetical protein
VKHGLLLWLEYINYLEMCVVRNLSQPKMDEISEKFRTLSKEELSDLHRSPSNLVLAKSCTSYMPWMHKGGEEV